MIFIKKWNELGTLLYNYNIKATFFITTNELKEKN